jgi:hypothetical protein
MNELVQSVSGMNWKEKTSKVTTSSTINFARTGLGLKPSLRGDTPATNRLLPWPEDTQKNHKENQEEQPISGRGLNSGPPEYEAGEVHTDRDEQLEAEEQQLSGAVFSGTNSGSIAGGLVTFGRSTYRGNAQERC